MKRTIASGFRPVAGVKRQGERGTAILITMLLTTALLAGGAVLVGMQLSGTRSVDTAKTKTLAVHCAEAGLSAARKTIASNIANWSTALCNPAAPVGTGTCVIGSSAAEPSFLSAIDRDLDGDSNPDFRITLLDNEDESATNDMTVDVDQAVWVVSTCIKYPDLIQQVRELVKITPGIQCNPRMKNGCGGI